MLFRRGVPIVGLKDGSTLELNNIVDVEEGAPALNTITVLLMRPNTIQSITR